MIGKLLTALFILVVNVISRGGYLGIVGLMAIESACVPLPSETIMPFAGYLVSTGRFELFWVATAGAIGCNLGSIVAYEIGKRGGRPFALRYGRYLLIGPGEIDAADRFFARWGALAVLIGRLLPVIRTFIAFPAGIARMRLLPFHVYTFVGSWPFCFLLAWVGMTLGDRWHSDPRLEQIYHKLDVVVVAVLALAAGLFLWHKLRGVRRPLGQADD